MTTSEDEAQTVVWYFFSVVVRLFRSFNQVFIRLQFFLQTCAAAKTVNRFVLSGLNDPGARYVRHALRFPLVYSGCESLLRRLLGDVKITKLANQGGYNQAPIRVIHCVHGSIGIG